MEGHCRICAKRFEYDPRTAAYRKSARLVKKPFRTDAKSLVQKVCWYVLCPECDANHYGENKEAWRETIPRKGPVGAGLMFHVYGPGTDFPDWDSRGPK